MAYFTTGGALAAALLLLSFAIWKRTRFLRTPYPPGPPGLPFIGNLRDIPPTKEWLAYTEWSRKYNSDVIHLDLAGAHLLVVNSFKASKDLFNKRSNIYSDKPRLPMVVELAGFDYTFGLFNYGEKWKAHRNLFDQHFNSNASSSFEPHHRKAVHEMLYRLAERPEAFLEHNHLMAGSLILNIGYGIDAQSLDDPYMVLAQKPVNIMTEGGKLGTFLVNSIPLLKYVPDWVPGTDFKRIAREWRKPIKDTADLTLQYVKDAMAKGLFTPSLVSNCLQELEEGDKETEEMIRGVAGTMFAAGSSTTVSALNSFYLAMVLHPHVFRKARQELDRVVGLERLPDFSDRHALPYIAAIMKECLRWNPVSPLPVAHRLMVDDVYEGYFMPAGSIVLGNCWAMLHNEEDFPEPERFNPERFLKDGELDPNVRSPESAAFGFGPRVCPGRHVALQSMFITIASVISVFDIEKASDEEGKEITPSGEYTSGLLCFPLPFKCSIKPRSQKALELVKSAYKLYHS